MTRTDAPPAEAADSTDQDAASAIWSGRIVGERYRIGERIGRGGMAEVYAAEHLRSGRMLAIKILAPPDDGGETPATEWAGRFQREAQAASLLDHPHIVEVLDLGVADETLFYVMELVRGTPLDVLIQTGDIGPRRALILTRQVLEALAYAHERGLVHRDLKPDNLMVVRAGDPDHPYDQVKLVDFGLVKLIGDLAGDLARDELTRTGLVFGTPDYIAPEQALGRPIDGRADLYSVGVTLFEMLTGRPPFVHEDAMAVVRMHVATAPPALRDVVGGQAHCTRAMQALLDRAMQKRPDDRFASAAEMIAELDRAFESIAHLPAEL